MGNTSYKFFNISMEILWHFLVNFWKNSWKIIRKIWKILLEKYRHQPTFHCYFLPLIRNPNIPSPLLISNNVYSAWFYMIRHPDFQHCRSSFNLYVGSFCLCFCLINLSLIGSSSGFYAPCALFLTLLVYIFF